MIIATESRHTDCNLEDMEEMFRHPACTCAHHYLYNISDHNVVSVYAYAESTSYVYNVHVHVAVTKYSH